MNLLTKLLKTGNNNEATGQPGKANKSAPVNYPLDLNNLTPWQTAFCEWNVERSGISLEESKQRYADSWNRLEGGHIGPLYRDFTDQAHNIFKIFFDDNPIEVFEAYKFHSYMHMLRMLTYKVPNWNEKHPAIANLPDRSTIKIMDFGCGLAQPSISLAEYLRSQGKTVNLVLVDIPTIRFEFLNWLGKQKGLDVEFVNCSHEVPIPEFPHFDVLIIRDVWEHLHDPLPYLEAFHQKMNSGGIMVTDIDDHKAEFMHVTPSLSHLRERITELGYEQIYPDKILRKP
jgi:2-polyprenyl-3-methyl-5-hydroxy-6-metoxy-1,4-benzoquinol methylase